jgi:hypothetical protein
MGPGARLKVRVYQSSGQTLLPINRRSLNRNSQVPIRGGCSADVTACAMKRNGRATVHFVGFVNAHWPLRSVSLPQDPMPAHRHNNSVQQPFTPFNIPTSRQRAVF